MAWRSGTELVQSGCLASRSDAWRVARISCGDACAETVEAVEGIIGIVEGQIHGRSIVWSSAKCRGILRQCLAALEERGDKGETADEVAAIETIWELCESVLLEEVSSRSGWRLITWLRMHGVDWVCEDEDYISTLSFFRRLAAQGGAPEDWQPNDSSNKEEEDVPFWRLVIRLIMRGRTREAWTVLETHSRRANFSDDWDLLAVLFRDMPQPPRVKAQSQQLSTVQDEEEMDALADSWKAYEESRRRWRRRLTRVSSILNRGEASLLAIAPPLRRILTFMESTNQNEAFSKNNTWEESLLAMLLYAPQPQWQHIDLLSWLKRNTQQNNIELASAARRALLQAMLRGQGVTAVKAVYEVGADVTANVSAFALAKLCAAAEQLGDGPPLPRGGTPDANTLVSVLGKELSEKLEAASHCVDSPWRLAARLLAAVDPVALPALLRRLCGYTPTSDANAIHLARACVRAGLDVDARLVLAARGNVYAKDKQFRLAATWYIKAELLPTPARDTTSLEVTLAPDGHAEQLCAILANQLRELLLSNLEQTLYGDEINMRLNTARAAVLGIADGLEGRRLHPATYAAFLVKYIDLLFSLRNTQSATDSIYSQHALLLAELLLESPPPCRTFFPHLIRLVLEVLRRDPIPAFSSDHVLGIMHRLIELCPTEGQTSITVLGEESPGLDTSELFDLRLALAETLTHALIAQNTRENPETDPHSPPRPPRKSFTATADELLVGDAATVPVFF